MNGIIDFFLEPYQSATLTNIILEVMAALFGVISVWFAKNENIWVYPSGIISTAIYIFICYTFDLFGDLIINIYYTFMGIYGWYMWTRIVKGEPLEISRSKRNDIVKAFAIFLTTAVFVVIVYLYFNRFDRLTDYFDTFTTGVFFAAMWLMANKKIEHWFLWIVGNIVSIPLYLLKGLGFTGLQFVVFLLIAIFGYIEWKKHLNNNLVIV